MKKIVYLALFTLLLLSSCTSTKEMSTFVKKDYEVETMGVGKDGTYLIRVTDYFPTSDEKVYIDGLKRDAVHCVIYKGIPAGHGSMRQPALMTNDTKIEGNEQALNTFFEEKQYLTFINSIVNSSKTITRIKGSKDFRISLVVSVNKDELRKYLTDNGIIKSLDYIF